MPTETANYGFTKDNEDEFYNVNVVNNNLDKIDTEMKRIENAIPIITPTDSVKWLGTVAGTANALTVTHAAITSYSDGLGVSFAANANSSAAMTLNINGLGAIPIKKANGTAFSNAKANGVYTVRYRAGAFILQGEGGAGNAQPNEVLTGKTFTNDNGEQVGTMIKGAYIKSWQWMAGTFTIDELDKTLTLNTAVNVNKSVIKLTFYSNEGISSSVLLTASFLSSLSIRVTRNQKGYASSSYVQFNCEVIEFDDSVKLQFGGTSILNNNSVKVNITPVNTNKTLLFYNYNDNTNEGGVRSMLMDYRANDQVNFVRGLQTSSSLTTIMWWLVEFP